MGGKSISNYESEAEVDKATILSDPAGDSNDIFEGCQITGVIFACYQTLIDIHTDEQSLATYEFICRWACLSRS
jgi:putative hydrolase of the HAD superfamily